LSNSPDRGDRAAVVGVPLQARRAVPPHLLRRIGQSLSDLVGVVALFFILFAGLFLGV